MSRPGSSEWDALKKLYKNVRPEMPHDKRLGYEEYVTIESPESRGSSDFENWLSPTLASVYWWLTGYRLQVVHPVSILPPNMISES